MKFKVHLLIQAGAIYLAGILKIFAFIAKRPRLSSFTLYTFTFLVGNVRWKEGLIFLFIYFVCARPK